MSTPPRLELIALTGIGEVRPGDDLAALLTSAADAVVGGLRTGDVLVVSSKVVSKAEGRSVAGTDRLAAIAGETVRVVAERLTPRGPARIVHGRSGLVLAAAGVDASNVDPGTVLLLPEDSDASARALRKALAATTGADVGVIVSDTLGRPWREGQVDLAVGAAGVPVTDDLRGATDTRGVPMEVTVRAVADELASAADLVKGKVADVPAALVRGWTVPFSDSAPGASSIARDPASDWFRLGHVEAVRSALGAPPGVVEPRPVSLDDVPSRLARAVAVALVTPGVTPLVSLAGSELTLLASGSDASALVALGAFAQRVVVAAWAESLTLDQSFSSGEPFSIALTASAAD